MPRASVNGLELEYEILGDDSGEPLLLIAGLGAQLISWDIEFCALLVSRGFRVIRYDNRDAGLSTKLDHLGVSDPMRVMSGEIEASYALDDMAGDAAGLLTALGISAAHVVGSSMGGFLAQLLAIRHPGKVLSLTSIMSAPGALSDDAPPTSEAVKALWTAPPNDREGMIEHGVWASRILWGSEHFDEDRARGRRTLAVDRGLHPNGALRQFAAIAAAPSRQEGLRGLRLPALVIHGEQDPLVPIENGRRTAAAIPGARLLTFPTMAHYLPPALWPEVVDAIAETAARAAAARRPN